MTPSSLIVDLMQVHKRIKVYSLKLVTCVGRYSNASDFMFTGSIVSVAAFFPMEEFNSQAEGFSEAAEEAHLCKHDCRGRSLQQHSSLNH